jgi:hypothetical protein
VTSREEAPLVRRFDWPAFQVPTSIFFWGLSRVAVNRLALECARRINPQFVWLEIQDPDHLPSSEDPSEAGEIPRERLYLAEQPEDIRPENAVANMALFTVIRPDEPQEVVGHLMDFLRLPTKVQQILSEMGPLESPGVFVCANAELISGFYPESIESTKPYLDVFRREGITLVTALTGKFRSDRMAFDYVFKVHATPKTSWKACIVECEKSPDDETIRAGHRVPAFAASA